MASPGENAVQAIRVHGNGTLSASDSATNGTGGFDALGGAKDVATLEMDGRAYAIVASPGDDGVQLIRVHGNGTLSANGSATNGAGEFDRLGNPVAIDTVEMDGRAYATVATTGGGGGIQLVRIHPNGTLSANGSVPHGSGLVLNDLYDIGAFRMGDDAYAITASWGGDGVQLVRILPNGTLRAAASATNGTGGFDALDGSHGLDTLEAGNKTYALVAAQNDNGVQLIRILPNGTLKPSDSVADGERGFDALTSPTEVAAFETGGETYAVVAAFGESAIQLIRILPDGTLEAAGSARNGDQNFALYNALEVAAFESSGKAYALATSYHQNNPVQLVQLSPTRVVDVNSAALDASYGTGSMIDIAVEFTDSVDVTAGATPQLLLATGGSDNSGSVSAAEYVSGSGTPVLTFRYTVQYGDAAVDLDYAGEGALVTRGAVTGAGGTAAYLGLPPPGSPGSLASSGNIAIDGATNAVLSVSSPDADGTYSTGRIIAVEVEFSAPVAITGEPALNLGTDPPRNAMYRGGNGTATVEFWYTVQPGDIADDLDYAGTGALSLPPEGGITSIDGSAANATLPPPGSTGSLGHSKDIAIDALPRAVLAAAGSATNGTGGFDRIGDAEGIAAVDAGGRTYAVVASPNENAVQLVRIHPNGTISASGSATDGAGEFDRLGGAQDVAALEMGGRAYAIVASSGDNAVQLIRVHGNGTLSANGSATNGAGGFDALDEPVAIDTVEMDGKAYAAVATRGGGGGVQLVRIHPNGTLSAGGSVSHGSGLVLNDLYDIGAFRMGDDAYAITASWGGGGVQLIRIHPNGTLRAAASATNGTGGFDALAGSHGLDTLEADNKTYALVASQGGDGGVQLIRILHNGTLRPSDSATDGERGFDALRGSTEVAAFETGGETYAVVAGFTDNAIQLIRILPDGTLEAAGSARNGERNFALNSAFKVAAFESSGKAYALVDSYYTDIVQLVRLSPTRVVGVDSAALDGTYYAGSAIDIAVEFTDSVDVTAGATPRLLLAAGGSDGSSSSAAAEYVSGSGTPVLTFRYTVQRGDAAVDLDYAGEGALVTRGAVTGAGGTAAYLGLPPPGSPGSLAGSGDIAIDGATTTVLSVSSPDADGTYSTGRIIAVEVEFSAPVAITGEPALNLGTDPPRNATYRGGNGTATVEFWYTVQPGDIADDLDYAGTGALPLPPGSGITSIDGPGIRTALPPPGSPGSLGHSKDIAINPAQIPVLAQAGFATDGTGGFDALGGADGVAAAAGAGGSTYALVAARDDSAVQVIRVNADGTLSANGSAANGTDGFVLGGADEVDVLVMDNKTYAVVASHADNAVQLIRVHADGALEAADAAINGSRNFTNLAGVVTVDAFSMDGRHYAIAGGYAADGIQLIRIHPDGTLSASDSATSGERGFEFVHDVYDIAAFEMDNKTYAVVPSWINNAVQLVRIHPNGTLAAGPSAVNGTGGFATLTGSVGVDTFDMGGETYAIVTANGDSRGVWPQPGAVQLIRVHGNGTLEPAGSARDAYEGVGDYTVLAAPYEVAAFDMGGVTYAIVISRTDNGVQMIRIRADGTLEAAGSATDGDPGLDTLRGPVEVVTLEAGGTMYALVAAPVDNGVQMIRLSPSRVVGVSPASPDGPYRPGSAVDIAVEFTESVDVTAGAPPRLLLAAGGAGASAAAAAEYVSGSGTPVLMFRYTVQYGDAAVDLDYAGAGALVTRGAVTGVGGGAAYLGLPPPGSPGSLAGSGDIELVGADLARRTAVDVADAVFTGTNTARITYGAPLGPPEDYDGPVYGAVTAAGGTEEMPPLPGGVSGLGTAVHTVRFGGSGVNASQAGTIALETDLHGTAANGTLYEFADDTIDIRAAGAAVRTAMPAGQMPVVTIERDGFVREVDVTGSGDSVRPAINVTGLAAAPLAQAVENNTVTFPGAGSTAIVAAFAEVSFPPNATARSVPADGLLELYVSVQQPPDARPLIERVAEALNVSASGVELRRVIEVGDNETRILFDMPVRILLVGQAGGTAFYVDDADNGTVVPIAALCAADDTAAVHAQLGGAGECQLDLGADRAVYAYHLTEFGTATTPTMLEMMVADAAAGTTVRVPAGTYAADMLVVDKPLTIEPADPDNPPLFTNYTHIVVRQPAGGPVVIRGLLFEDTARTPAGAGPASITVESARGMPQQRPGASATVTIEGNTFRNTCGTAVRVAAAAEGAPPIAGLMIEGNTFYDIGGNRGSGGCAPPPPAAGGPGRADAIAAGRYDAAALAAGASAFAAQLANTTVRDNYIFGTTYTGIRIAAADGLVVEGNHVEGVPDDGIRVLASKSVAVRDNAIVGANSAPYAQAAAGGAGAAIEVWSGSDDVAVTLNRISGSAGAFYLCAGTCDPGPDAADGTGGAPATVPRAPINSAGGLDDVRFNHNVLAESNTGALIASGAAGMLNARSNYYPGYAASAGDRIAPAGAAAAAPVVSYAPALDDAGPVRIGAIVADGPSSPIRSIDSAVRAAFELGVHGFNARQAEIGGFVGLEPAVRAVDSPGSAAAARAGHAAALADLRSGASADARMLPVLHNSIASAMAAYDASGAAALAGISAMGATHGHYPFVNARNGTIAAHGANASLVGDAAIVRALAGGTDESLRALFDFESTAGIAGTGVDPGYPNASWKWWAYDFVDPATGGTVSKRSVLALHPGPDGALHGADDLVFGAGYYPGPGAAHLVVAAGDAPAAVNASDGVVIVSPASTAAQLAAPDMLFRLAPPDSKLAGAVLAQAAEGRSGAAGITVVALNDSASLQSMGLAGELARIGSLDALPDGVTAVRVVSYDSSAADGWESGAAAAIRSALPQGSAAVYAGRADAFAALAAGFGSRAPENTKWYAAGELARADLAAAGPAAAALALAVQLTVLSQHAAPDAAIDAALALPGTGIALDASTRGPAYAAYDAPGLLGRAIASTAGVPGSPAGVAAAIEEDVARTHDGALGSPLILDRNGDLALPVTYAVSSFPDSIGGAWTAQPAQVGELSCGIALERAVLDFGNLAPGQRSRVASQTVINTGTLTYETIRLAPTEWTYAGMPETLPASITELRELGRTAAFLDARTGIQIAQGLGPGMDRDLQYRIDLSGYQAIPAGQVSQTISYLVMCRDAS